VELYAGKAVHLHARTATLSSASPVTLVRPGSRAPSALPPKVRNDSRTLEQISQQPEIKDFSSRWRLSVSTWLRPKRMDCLFWLQSFKLLAELR